MVSGRAGDAVEQSIEESKEKCWQEDFEGCGAAPHAHLPHKKWNYHKQMGADEIETDIRFDTIWRRPTHSFGSGKKFFNFSVNGEDMGSFENPSKSTSSSNKLHWSLSELELDINTDINLIKKKYKELVKLHHPDVKGNSKKNIDRFRNLVEAYNYLIERYKND